MKVSQRTFQMLVDTYEDSLGVDFERIYNVLVDAQGRTGLCLNDLCKSL